MKHMNDEQRSEKAATRADPQAEMRHKTPPDDATQRPACVPGVSRVYLASPFRADTPDTRDRHRLYLFDACEDAIDRGEAYIASHALYTPHLDERDPTQRDQGLRMGLAWIAPGVWTSAMNPYDADPFEADPTPAPGPADSFPW